MRAGILSRFEYAMLPIIFFLFAYGCNRPDARSNKKAPEGYSKPSPSGISVRNSEEGIGMERMKNLEEKLYRLGVIAGELDRKNGRLNMDDMVANMSMDPPTALGQIGILSFYENDNLTKKATECLQELEKLPYEKQEIAVKSFVAGYSSQRSAPGASTSPTIRKDVPTIK